ncbi:hypothetical protein M407DRAFT_241547 [Tulasnella calospora MUT 4182]|uniref:Uncharacterized protein n=1 Tax=Tulasnella calospora MUT 4182 TaxID=1051891 RepID=A0A0C3QSR4_9AGAM|nr:hypothetical protein M407DRAFT_241547 [Tulasnella calospora MUT 4182]
MIATASPADALEVEWSTGSDGLQTLSIPSSQIPGYDLLGVKWAFRDPRPSPNYLGICAVNSKTKSTAVSGLLGDLLTDNWKLSSVSLGDGTLTLTAMAGQETLYPRWAITNNVVAFSDKSAYALLEADMFFEPI